MRSLCTLVSHVPFHYLWYMTKASRSVKTHYDEIISLYSHNYCRPSSGRYKLLSPHLLNPVPSIESDDGRSLLISKGNISRALRCCRCSVLLSHLRRRYMGDTQVPHLRRRNSTSHSRRQPRGLTRPPRLHPHGGPPSSLRSRVSSLREPPDDAARSNCFCHCA